MSQDKRVPEVKLAFADWGMGLRQDGLNSSPSHQIQENGIALNLLQRYCTKLLQWYCTKYIAVV